MAKPSKALRQFLRQVAQLNQSGRDWQQGMHPYIEALDQNVDPKVVPVTVFFVDLRDFTTLVESETPKRLMTQLNQYFDHMTNILMRHGAIIDKYIGDAILAYFEAPHPLSTHLTALHGVAAAHEMLVTLEMLNTQWEEEGFKPLNCSIGIASGPVLKAYVGSRVRKEITIIGDTVNVACRLQKLNKAVDSHILISDATHSLVRETYDSIYLGEITLRGKQQPVRVFTL